MVEIGRNLWRSSGPTPRSKQCHLESVAEDCVQMAFESVQAWNLHNLPGQPVPVFSHLHKAEKCFTKLKSVPVFLFLPAASCPATGHYWKEPGSAHFAPSLPVLIYINKIPFQPSLVWAEQSQLCLENASSLAVFIKRQNIS